MLIGEDIYLNLKSIRQIVIVNTMKSCRSLIVRESDANMMTGGVVRHASN